MQAGDTLYQLGTFELMLTMPVRQEAVITSRFLYMYVTNFIWGAVIMVPAMYYGFTDRTGRLTMNNVLAIFQPVHAQALGLALLLAFISTLICFLLAFPLAMILKGSSWGRKGFIVFIFVLPMVTVPMLKLAICSLE